MTGVNVNVAAEEIELAKHGKNVLPNKTTSIKKENDASKSGTSIIEIKKIAVTDENKRKRGRPSNKSKGIENRKQYTLTLKEETYKRIMEKAHDEEISFAKFVERAAIEYLNNHH